MVFFTIITYSISIVNTSNCMGHLRAIRNVKVKVKEKVSAHFRYQKGAKTFAIIRFVIDTAMKKGVTCFIALFSIATPIA
jgi:hypothetical protein